MFTTSLLRVPGVKKMLRFKIAGAGDGTRTRDSLLGKQATVQLFRFTLQVDRLAQ